MKKRKTVVLLSGGVDSSVLLYWCAKKKKMDVHALAIDYGQRHAREIESAREIAESLGVPFTVFEIKNLASILPGSSLTDPSVSVPHGHYKEETMKKTVVPNRNMIFISIATAFAIAHGMDGVAIAPHAGDHTIYPDCRPAFINLMARAVRVADWKKIKLWRPFNKVDKTTVVRVGYKLGVPFEKTWSCYEGGELHCGRCGACIERKEAFQLAEVPDPIQYLG
jgi:7-cyano-7-deazaguanine synthase